MIDELWSMNCPARYAELPERYRAAIGWAASEYRDWRKRFCLSFEEHAKARPEDFSAQAWAALYDAPFGRQDWNRYVARIHRAYNTGMLS
jgi:hypothetical protein